MYLTVHVKCSRNSHQKFEVCKITKDLFSPLHLLLFYIYSQMSMLRSSDDGQTQFVNQGLLFILQLWACARYSIPCACSPNKVSALSSLLSPPQDSKLSAATVFCCYGRMVFQKLRFQRKFRKYHVLPGAVCEGNSNSAFWGVQRIGQLIGPVPGCYVVAGNVDVLFIAESSFSLIITQYLKYSVTIVVVLPYLPSLSLYSCSPYSPSLLPLVQSHHSQYLQIV